jgi:L-ascorbate metabolism protein UlaG (beta-lactamase superfamily)
MTVAIKWFPPSWVQIKTLDKIIYIDPAYLRTYFLKYPQKIEFSKWPDPIDGLPENLEKGDIILITHEHADHCKKITADRLKSENTIVVAPKRTIKKLGSDIRVIEPGEELTVNNIRIKAVFAYNRADGNSTRKIHRRGFGVGYRITVEDNIIYHAGDTDLIPEMNELGPVDVALLPIGGTYTMDVGEAVKAAQLIKPGVVIPIHHAKADPSEFKSKLEAASFTKVMLLQTGEIYYLN